MELECKSADKGSCAVGNAIVGMVIGGRAARACDVCGKERARWYCAADLAYLCERCDGSVHSANAVAGRHERVRLGPDGAPLKMAQKLSTSAKRDAAAAAGPSPGANLNPRKKPRSIRRHKPSSVHASKHGISLSPATNRIANSSLNLSNSLMYAPNHSIMINNPRNNLDFIANGNMEFNNKFVVKAEPLSPVDIGEQVKVPDHTDDDPLFESLFDFRDLQDDDLFLHQVPIYIPGAHNQGNSPAICDSKQYIENDETKPTIIITPYEESKELGLSTSSCATTHPSGPSQAQFDSASLPVGKEAEDNGALLSGKCEEPDRFIDSGTGLCELDQIDFDSMLHGDDEDGAEESHTNNICALHADVNSYDYTDASNCPITRDGSGSYAEDSCAHHGTDMVDDDDIDDNYDAAEHAGHGEAFDIDTMGSESPRTWLCKVKVESPPELDGMLQANGGYDDALLKQKLSCKADSQSGFKLGLKLNFEDVLHAWSDRGTFWMDGHPPLQLDNCLDFLGGWFVPDMSSTSTSTEGDGQHLVPVINHKCKKSDGSAREASVMRYREKRRTRLFCKKIRYEVRKLNAEKRPRMKGRFVKRNSIAI